MKRARAVILLVVAASLLLPGCGQIRAIIKDREPQRTVVSDTPTPTEPEETEPAKTPEPTKTAEPTPTSQPAETPAPACASVTVTYSTGLVTATGLDESGAKLWQQKFKLGEETELTPYSEATVDGGFVYLQVNYHMLALDGATGTTMWTSQYEGGLCRPVVVNGNVYTCSYYGSPLVILSAKDGSTLFEAAQVDDTFFWPGKIERIDGNLLVTFDQAGEAEGTGTALFDMNGKLINKAIEAAH